MKDPQVKEPKKPQEAKISAFQRFENAKISEKT